jgi:hypothetical protein
MNVKYNKEYDCWVSEDGIVLKALKPSKRGPNGLYKCVSVNGKRIDIHRLVAKTHINNPDNKPIVCHKDDNPSNNSASNLFWGTYKENIEDMYNKARAKPRGISQKKTYRKDKNVIKMLLKGMSQTKIAKYYGVTIGAVSQRIKRLKKNGILKNSLK